jgi:hypothetical protein
VSPRRKHHLDRLESTDSGRAALQLAKYGVALHGLVYLVIGVCIFYFVLVDLVFGFDGFVFFMGRS